MDIADPAGNIIYNMEVEEGEKKGVGMDNTTLAVAITPH